MSAHQNDPDQRAHHRVDRVLGFFSSRLNWDLPAPSHAGECVSPLCFRGGDTLARGRGGGRVPIRTRGQTLWYARYIVYVLCGCTSTGHFEKRSIIYFKNNSKMLLKHFCWCASHWSDSWAHPHVQREKKHDKTVLLHNDGSFNACTIKWSITYCVFLNKARDRMVLFLSCCLYKIVISTTLGNVPCIVLN